MKKGLRVWCLGLLLCVLVAACRSGGELRVEGRLRYEDFRVEYNRQTREWLEGRVLDLGKEIERLGGGSEGEVKQRKEAEVMLEQMRYRLSLGDYLKEGSLGEVPKDLVWENGVDEPEIGDVRAKKGGSFRKSIAAFPPTIRPFGENSNNSFRGDLYDNIDVPLVGLHPGTMRLIPGLAREWAVSRDGRTVYFRLDGEAKYSNGVRVRARDFAFAAFVRVSDAVVNPYAKQFFREELAQIAVYDEETLSISFPAARYLAPALAGAIVPSEASFYGEYGADYATRYQWRFPPTTGAYEVREDGIVKGVSVTQVRVKDWWARDKKFYRYRYNADAIVHRVVRDPSKGFELFRAGEFDMTLLGEPSLWYEKSEMPPVYAGYMERAIFYNRYPRLPRGLYVNVARGLLRDRDVRVGMDFAMNWEKVAAVLFRGDVQRLNEFNEGFGEFSNPGVKARGYVVEKARENFAKAGFTKKGGDGILRREDGTRLSVLLSYPAIGLYDRMMAILQEDAKRCGLELRLDGLEATVYYKKTMLKQHEVAIASWQTTPPVPEYYQFLHSSTAVDAKGEPKPQTNNLFTWHRADTDALCEQVRAARTGEEIREASWKLQQIIHDEAIFMPAYTSNFVRLGYWRWVCWPESKETHFCPPVTYDPFESYVWWVDREKKGETEAAMRSGETFPEVTHVFDEYREPEKEDAK